MKISERTGKVKRKYHELNFWFIVKHSLKEANRNHEKKDAFLISSLVMAAITLESLINNLSEHYLPTETHTKLINPQLSSKERIKKTIKHLSGQFGEYTKVVGLSVPITITKIDLSQNFFDENNQNSNWRKIIDLICLRNEIAHWKTKDEIVEMINGKSTIIQQAPHLRVDEIPTLINNLEIFFENLKILLQRSVKDHIPQRLNSFFDFLNS